MIESVLSCSCHDVAKYWPVGMTRQEESTALRDVIISYLFFNFSYNESSFCLILSTADLTCAKVWNKLNRHLDVTQSSGCDWFIIFSCA